MKKLLAQFHQWLLEWKPIHLCWWFRKHNLKIPKYFIGKGLSSPPVVENRNSAAIADTAFNGVGYITSLGTPTFTIVRRGFCYLPGTVLMMNPGEPNQTHNPVYEDRGGAGFSTGEYSLVINDLSPLRLTPNTNYVVRAFIKDSLGVHYLAGSGGVDVKTKSGNFFPFI